MGVGAKLARIIFYDILNLKISGSNNSFSYAPSILIIRFEELSELQEYSARIVRLNEIITKLSRIINARILNEYNLFIVERILDF